MDLKWIGLARGGSRATSIGLARRACVAIFRAHLTRSACGPPLRQLKDGCASNSDDATWIASNDKQDHEVLFSRMVMKALSPEQLFESLMTATNDKAGSKLNLVRWVSARTIKETFSPPGDYRYDYMVEE